MSDTTDADTPEQSTTGSVAPEDAPLAPYPSTLGRPLLHAVRQLRWGKATFNERALADHDVVRTRVIEVGDVYHVGHPELMRRILLTDREDFRKIGSMRLAFGDGLLSVEGEEWERQRERLQPLFVRESLRGRTDEMVARIRRYTDRWTDGDRLDLQQEFRDITLAVLFAVLFDRDLPPDGNRRLHEAAENLHEWFAPSTALFPGWVPTPARRRFRRAKATLREEADRLIEESVEDAPSDPSEDDDLLSLLAGIRTSDAPGGSEMTDEQLVDQVVTMTFAGHDTTSTLLTFACYALATHPEVDERFRAEVDRLGGPPTPDDLDDLEVTERVLDETLRLYPPAPSIGRSTDTDVVLDGYRVPEDELLLVHPWVIQRDPRFFDDPETFRPSRWSGDLRAELHDFAFAPFGGGPRICIGRQFAMQEAKVALALIGRRYDLTWLGDDDGRPPLATKMTLRMEEGQQFRITER